jgi:hypothetical protein
VETELIKTPQNYDVAQNLNCFKEKNKTKQNILNDAAHQIRFLSFTYIPPFRPPK